MSHFNVLVCVSPERLANHNGDVKSAVREMMAPYQQNNCGLCPEEYLEFNDIEEEYRKQYENNISSKVRFPDGELIPTFEEYMEDYCGYERDAKTGKYGYWENPNYKWDYWLIGGRWRGYFYVTTETKPRNVDICKVKDLDLPRIEAEMLKRAKKFWDEFAEFRKTGTVPEDDKCLYTVRSRAMDVGLLEVVQDPEEGKKRGGFRWADTMKHLHEDDDRRDWYDVINQDITKKDFISKWAVYYCPIITYAALDDDGWHEPGSVVWFGCSLADSESLNEYSKAFMNKFIYENDPETVLVVCDCHI